ncbi:MAG: TetR family transcriptional regulator C-terminal domain-containing protein [Candidatus Omnitrophica bacterium]|nr:TetR family transcriptional regulator C-terminal domain-containing protein [Candidatus Omnitrophota bacterium]
MTIAETRERILDASSQAIIAKSYNGVGLNKILKNAGVPKGSFYHHFKSKEDLAIAVIEKSTAEHLDRVREFLTDRSRSPLERLREAFRLAREVLVEQGFNRECLVPKMALEIANLSEPVRAAIKCGMDQFRSLVAQCIREAQAAGEVDGSHDPEALAGFIQASWEGVMIRTQIDRDIAPVDEFVGYIFDTFLKR